MGLGRFSDFVPAVQGPLAPIVQQGNHPAKVGIALGCRAARPKCRNPGAGRCAARSGILIRTAWVRSKNGPRSGPLRELLGVVLSSLPCGSIDANGCAP
jgi:hypothetical protein